MIKVNNALKVEFEAFGQIHVAYTETYSWDAVESEIKKISDTATIRGLHTDVVDRDLFEEKNLSKVMDWNRQIEQSFAHEL